MDSSKDVYLIRYTPRAGFRAHFALYLVEGDFPGTGILIHVVGLPMSGFELQIRQDYDLRGTTRRYTFFKLGQVSATSAATMQQLASRVPPPGKSENFLAPVDGDKNKRCQEWTVEYVNLLVQHGLLNQNALQIVHAQRDPPDVGITLKPVHRGQPAGGGT
ncbi:hypothetical protein ABEF92_005798 [Exophiala dermatitidis]|uniref:Uncharacterized protein n=1 Tax=Exophiala dermatitidis (strain ATCC 34100 / CBS 525.76 / NIH/UT8656) TaxID=858893 RepID=H6BK88_EXODN|nr:uncharacterized protein HMPREF1120_00732 [Exophiala dermatitidis NIH/UT8656]EHY52521.1 hypothetical protein HMPREF1120_00732 [Exophiala dermatitidis NIH/UT8656]